MKKIYFIASPHIKDDVWVYSFFDKKEAEKVNDRINHEAGDNNIVYELPLLDDPSVQPEINKLAKDFVSEEAFWFCLEERIGESGKTELARLLVEFVDKVFNVE